MSAYLPPAECKRGHVYRLSSRNLAFGVFAPEKENGFIGIRDKFGSRYLFTEHHWDNGAPYGTAKPLEDMGPLKDPHIALLDTLPTACGYCGERLEFKRDLEDAHWEHITGDGSCTKPYPVGGTNHPLYQALEAVEREQGEGASQRKSRFDAEEEKDVVGVLDNVLDAVLARPLMFGASDPMSLEILVRLVLGIRNTWAPEPGNPLPWDTAYGRWIAEFFGDETPNNLAAGSRLMQKFGLDRDVYTREENKGVWEEVTGFYKELVRRTREATQKDPPSSDEAEEPVTVEVLHDLLGLVMAKSGAGVLDVDMSDVPSLEALETLTPQQREEAAEWAGVCHAEASDNDCRAGPCPQPLRDLLPEDHFYKKWRLE